MASNDILNILEHTSGWGWYNETIPHYLNSNPFPEKKNNFNFDNFKSVSQYEKIRRMLLL